MEYESYVAATASRLFWKFHAGNSWYY